MIMKVSAVILVALTVVVLLRRRPAALRHWVLAVAIVCAGSVPVVEMLVPAWPLTLGSTSFVPSAGDHQLPTGAGVPPAAPSAVEHSVAGFVQTDGTRQTVALSSWLARIWLTGVAIMLAVLVVGFCRLAWLASRSRPVVSGRWVELVNGISREYGLRRPVHLLQSTHPSLLATWGLTRPKIILPAAAGEWSEDLVRVVLCHELAHIRRRDWIVQIAGEILRAAYWFNPIVWIFCRRLRLESEHACDDAVLNRGVQGPEYATHLLDLARALNHRTWFPAPAMARPSNLQRRVAAMLNDRLNRNPISAHARVATVILLVVATIAVAAAQAFGTFSGSLVDPHGAVLPGVRVTLSNAERQTKHEVQTNRNGQFEFAGLLPGDYVFEAKQPGFKPYVAALTMTGANVQRSIMLQIGELSETITIVDSGPGVSGSTSVQSAVARPNPPCSGARPGTDLPIGGNIRPPAKIRDVRPIYPPAESGRSTEVTVVLDARIGLDGFVKDVRVREGAHPAFADSLVTAVTQWQFDSTLLNCVPVEPSMTVTGTFLPRRTP
jgi:beta-lactamase regulating signal transducer with metallopeptidase domain